VTSLDVIHDIFCQSLSAVSPSVADMRSSRLVATLMLLQARPIVTARELATELEVSLRTVYRDVEALSSAGIPVYAEQGRAGGYRLVDGYRTRLTGLTEDEALSLFVVGLPGPAADLGLGAQAASAERKLLAALGPEQRVRAGRLRDRFSLDTSSWYHPAEQPPYLAALATAVLQDRVVDIAYRRWEAPREVERRLAPYGLVLKNGTWYLAAAPADQPAAGARTYRVSNVLRLTATEDRFERPTDFRLSEFWREHLDAFERRRLTRTAVVRLAPDLVRHLPDLSDSALRQAAARVAPDEDGWTTVELPIERDEMAARQLLPHAGEVEVVSPASLRDLMVEKARGVLALYG
jgi:predicted DNA-binding transcriptional regulator YafY